MGARIASFQRLLRAPSRSFFLFGPRGVGKSTWLAAVLPGASTINLLDNRLFTDLSREPESLEGRLAPLPRGAWVCIDEVQRIPSLLNEVHRLIEKYGWRFALSGSSARKLRRGGANLLGGRAITRQMGPFVSAELGETYDMDRAMSWGTLPLVALNPKDARDILFSYVHTYIREEVREEGLIRKAEPFLRFLEVGGMLNGMQTNASNISREAAIPRASVDSYFSILEDTLVAHRLPAFQPHVKVREQTHPKLYWFDPGVARAAAGLLDEPVDRLWQGRALETLILHELRVYNEVRERYRPIRFYRTRSGAEIDFVVETRKPTSNAKARLVGIEVKLSKKWDPKWEKPLRELASSGDLSVEGMFGVYTGPDRLYRDGFHVLPVLEFLTKLYDGDVF